MAKDAHPNFEDPVLKAALKRAVGGEGAPASLRARVEKAMAAEAAKPLVEARRRNWQKSPLVGLAAAALLIVGIGLIFNHLWQPAEDDPYRLPVAMARDMVAAHDRSLALASAHEIDAPKDDLNKVRDTLKDKLGHPVLVASLGNGWTLEGARVARIGETPASQLVFKKGDESVSVFSVSGRAYYASQDGSEYKQTEAGHPIAGFVQKGIVHCVVGSKGTKLDENDLARIRDAVREYLDGAGGGSSSRGNTADCPRSRLALANL